MIDNYNNEEGFELDWDDELENNEPDFILLPEGDYNFEVIKYERGRFNGSDKFPPCQKAIVFIKVEIETGINIIKQTFLMHTRSKAKLCEFFTSIGQCRKGDTFKMNWPAVPGSRGRAKIAVREWKNEEKGTKGEVNEIKKFYPYAEPAPFEPQQTTFTPGAF